MDLFFFYFFYEMAVIRCICLIGVWVRCRQAAWTHERVRDDEADAVPDGAQCWR